MGRSRKRAGKDGDRKMNHIIKTILIGILTVIAQALSQEKEEK